MGYPNINYRGIINVDKKPLTMQLIEDGLGYCCTWAFFSLYRDKQDISRRLGLHPDTVKLWKKKFNNGELYCLCKEKCLKDKLPKAREIIHLIRAETNDASS